MTTVKDAVDKNIHIVSDLTKGAIDNLACEGFGVDVKWELEATNDDGVFRSTVFCKTTV